MKAFRLYTGGELGGMRVIAGMATAGKKKKEEGREKNEEQRERVMSFQQVESETTGLRDDGQRAVQERKDRIAPAFAHLLSV